MATSDINLQPDRLTKVRFGHNFASFLMQKSFTLQFQYSSILYRDSLHKLAIYTIVLSLISRHAFKLMFYKRLIYTYTSVSLRPYRKCSSETAENSKLRQVKFCVLKCLPIFTRKSGLTLLAFLCHNSETSFDYIFVL